MIPQIRPTAPHHLVTRDGELEQPESSKNLVKAVAVVRREGMLVVGKVLGNLVHLGCLIHRTADEEDPFSHSRPPRSLITGPHNKVNKIERNSHSRHPGESRNDEVVFVHLIL
jgi:hypothetical protein